MSDVIRHVTISGRVQGVGYRYFVERKAQSRDLEGWVRNRRDGSVEAVLAGPTDAVTAVIAACRRGPSSARVDALQGHAPFAAATQAVYETLKALREGASPKSLKGLASSELTGRAMREADVKARASEFLGLKKP